MGASTGRQNRISGLLQQFSSIQMRSGMIFSKLFNLSTVQGMQNSSNRMRIHV